jgi:acylphosphatase
VRVLYCGDVQGVGFRWRAVEASRALRVTGYVRNLADGRVELVAEGDRAEVERLLGGVRSRMSGLIAGEEIAWAAASGELREFGVRR